MPLRILEVCNIGKIEGKIALLMLGLFAARAKQHELQAPVHFRENCFAVFKIPGVNQSPLLNQQGKKSFIVVIRYYP